MAWTTPATLVTGGAIQASWANTHVRDNERYLKGLDGAVAIQDSVSVTGSVAASASVTAAAGANVGTTGAVTGELKALGARFTGQPAFAGGAGLEVGYGGGTAFIFGYNRVGPAYVPLLIDASVLNFAVAGVAVAVFNATGLSGNGSQLTALNGTQVTSGTIPDARLSANVAFAGEAVSQFTNDAGYAVSGAAVAATQLTGRVTAVDVTLADEATSNLCADSAGGWFFISVAGTGILALVYSAAGATTYIALDPSSQFSNTGVAAGKTNIGIGGGFVVLYNKTGVTRTYRVERVGGG